ncbi:hypothetical protein [Ahniella affigens]|uniref:hypothetical protein n=1 Tax=Ahniella affigens TaxID=2021234 RepID=UPI0011B27C44|nr:hypothetical protein [Ahniella affigens]
MSAAVEYRHFAISLGTIGGEEIRKRCPDNLDFALRLPDELYLVFAEVGSTSTRTNSGQIVRKWFLTAAGTQYNVVAQAVYSAQGAHSGLTKLRGRDVTPERYISLYRGLLKHAAPFDSLSLGYSLTIELPDEWNSKAGLPLCRRARGAHPLTDSSLISSKLGRSRVRWDANASPALTVAFDGSLESHVILTWLCQAQYEGNREPSFLRVDDTTAEALYSAAQCISG